MASMDTVYVAPITLGFTPANGDLIGGTVNGVEVNGEWNGNGVALYKGALDVSTYKADGSYKVCAVGVIDGQPMIAVQSSTAPTTDYELHIYRYTPADIVQIPQEYVEGLEDVAADANAAKTAAETAQTTANAAKTAAKTAQTTANAAKTAAETAQTTANAAKTAAETAVKPTNGNAYWFRSTSAEKPYTRIYIDDYTHHRDTQIFQSEDTALTLLMDRDGGTSDASTASNPATIKLRNNAGLGGVIVDGVKAFIVPSSTSGSTKKFKITVDDSGTISATEVTQ